MAEGEVVTVKDVVHKLQLCLLEGIKDENQLIAVGSLLSRSDYQDVVTERSIANMCGYPLCDNPLPSERPRKGHYRISLKEHKVYDLHETYMYCSTNCAVNSGAFAGSLQDERSSTLNPAKLNEVLNLFKVLHLRSTEDVKKNGDLVSSNLKIQEKVDVKGGEVSLEEWMGPSNAIEGYVPQRDRSVNPALLKNVNRGSKKNKHAELQNEVLNEIDFSSTIITQDEYSISKFAAPVNNVSSEKFKEPQTKTRYKVKDDDVSILGKQVDALQLHSAEETEKTDKNDSCFKVDKFNSGEVSSGPSRHDVTNKCVEVLNMSDAEGKYALDGARDKQLLKSSLKSSNSKKMARSVTWADENIDDGTGKKTESSSKISEYENQACGESGSIDMEEDNASYRFGSAEACAEALTLAAEAVASGSDVSDAVSKAGIIILPPPQEVDEAIHQKNDEMLDVEPTPLKWPRKPGMPNFDVFESENSWYDRPPEGFNMTLSPFATMFDSLFTWISSSSLAFIYGHDESNSEEYLSINGREYPHKIVLSDGRSTEIKQTLAVCLARALPGLVADLRLPVPVSTLEQGMVLLLDTMSFVDPLPAFRMKQWQLIALLFLDALSVCRIPTLTPYMTARRTSLPKVLDNAQISTEEYEIMKDLIIPLGRVPRFSMQSGG
ncbi:putative RNA polymerase II subunit B1 CTD phosphatase RPAP2 [Capsicum chacoense]|uniref:putative RNA polymerase II subunit B1 CTD phosphatase RPAP2 homolog n=1 Tax=Capsicum annuum TaxID=4072 RepID=UPI001FB07C6C|nr:putative RNA polymerase II subunit B1 CTD phosphatase RPAP2 homolog [Capsicum annuum]XP_016573505.2 putative RNA polymerase II subunit B1 CTD phosphatase RPAP2 homolog [Capsicum annuum]XP_047250735.1 putative RNA polymerase II subunit B1 CTD phosphatase RPAP2 homolog [Capsicum annuum]KAF3644726.1 putative RNA polymerase II subunit B1 CTD phosphatase RPAP2 -like protein [Capsicum annuum]